MGDYNRSRSYGPGMMQMQAYSGPPPAPQQQPPPPPSSSSSYDLRCYSASYAQTQMANYNYNVKDLKLKKGKSISGSKALGVIADPEFQRKKRVASYKMYSVEGKVKGSIRKSFRWLKYKYTQVLYGWW